MKINKYFLLPGLLLLLAGSACSSMQNPEPEPPLDHAGGEYIEARDGTKLFVYTLGEGLTRRSIYVLSGYTGINHTNEMDVLSLLSEGGKNRVVVIHPRGTGYSEGRRGDVRRYSDFTGDYIELINRDILRRNSGDKVILYGHSISSAICLVVAGEIRRTDGIILVNPPYKMKKAPGMTPGFFDYLKYAGYMIFAPHAPIVNMAGDAQSINNPAERLEAEQRGEDPLLVKYISMYMMIESKKILDHMAARAKEMEAPLLLIYGAADSLVDKSGCDQIFANWRGEKQYEIVENGPHGKQTVVLAGALIKSWLEDRNH